MSLEVLGIILALFKIGEDGWIVQSVTTTVSSTKGKNAGSTFARCLSALPPHHVATLIQGLHYSKAIRIQPDAPLGAVELSSSGPHYHE